MLAACTALSLHDPNRELRIYTDNESTVKSITKLMTDPEPVIREHPQIVEAVTMAKNVLASRNQQTEITHIYSHLLDGKMPKEMKDSKMAKMEEKFKGEDLGVILHMNKLVDERAASAASNQCEQRQVIPLSLEDGDYIAYNRTGQRVFDVRAEVKKKQIEDRWNRLQEEAKESEHIGYIRRKNIDWKYAGLIYQGKSKEAIKLQNFVTRARRTLFPNKLTWSAEWDWKTGTFQQPSDFRIEKHHGGRVMTKMPTCDSCEELDHRTHWIVCEHWKDDRAAIKKKVLKIIRKHNSNVVDIPVWWDHTAPRSGKKEWKKLEESDAGIAVRALTPEGVTNLLQQGCNIAKDKISTTLSDIVTTIVRHYKEIWQKRNRILYASNPPEPT
jgi:hypothetical protein